MSNAPHYEIDVAAFWPTPIPISRRCVPSPIVSTSAAIPARLKGLRLDQSEPVRIGGWAFRGLLNLPVAWDAD